MNSFESPSSATKKDDTIDRLNETSSAKEKELQEIKIFVDSTDDDLGLEIDENIKEIVIALNAVGFQTTQSCEGHCGDERGHIMPWVELAAPDEPEYQYNNQRDVNEKVAKKYGISVDKLERMGNMDAYWEADKEAEKNGETEEYKKWNKQNEILLEKMISYLKEFYDVRGDQSEEIIQIFNNFSDGRFRIYCGGEDYDKEWEDLDDTGKKNAKQNLGKYRHEMNEFAKFLLDKYLKE